MLDQLACCEKSKPKCEPPSQSSNHKIICCDHHRLEVGAKKRLHDGFKDVDSNKRRERASLQNGIMKTWACKGALEIKYSDSKFSEEMNTISA